MAKTKKTNPPKKVCMVNLVFSIADNKEAMDLKQYFDNAVKNIKEKRYQFQIIET